MTDSSTNILQKNEKMLDDIQSLQQIEQQLFNNLESNPNLTNEQKQKIIEKMNQISNMRLDLYKTLGSFNDYLSNSFNSSSGTLKQQSDAIKIVESELNAAKKRVELIEEEKNNKIRLVEINNYYSDKYAEHIELMKIIIFTLIPIMIISFLNNKGVMPSSIYYILVIIVSLIGALFFWKRYTSIIMRDNMNYQEYDWSFNPNKMQSNISSSLATNDPWKTDINLGTCIGNACCSDGLTYDSNLNKCIAKQVE